MLYVYRVADGAFIRSAPNVPPYDPQTEAVQEYPDASRLDRRLHRYDGSVEQKWRLATAQEIIDFDAVRLDDIAQAEFETNKTVKALGIWVAQKLSIPLVQARNEILAIRKTL